MHIFILLLSFFLLAGCALFDLDDNPPQSPVPHVADNLSCTDLWKHYTDELQLVNDDEANWGTHDDKAVQYLMQFSGNCNVADTGETAATDLRCKALWGIYVREASRMTKDERTWREHDIQQTEAMNRIRSNCDKTACILVPGVRCNVPTNPS